LSDIEKNHSVYVGIGSNINQIFHIKECIKAFNNRFINIKLSPTYESSSMGFDGPNFYNLVACFNTDLEIDILKQTLKKIEMENGRYIGEEKFSSRTLDIDILYYDDLIDDEMNIPRHEILNFDFVLRPLFDLSPSYIHPVTQKTHYKMLNETIYKKMIINEIDINFKE
tara:strand:+ start:247 stop:753 length:507 start_codon:yes stop_codon:yes gene_type:complete